MATATILNLFNPPKSCNPLRWIFLQRFMKFDESNQTKFNRPFFVSMATAVKFVQRFRFFWLIWFH
jgi:hypothetical protein